MNKPHLKLVTIVVSVIVAFVGLPYIVTSFSLPLSNEPLVLVVGDFSSEDAFGTMVDYGIKVGLAEDRIPIEVQRVEVPEPTAQDVLTSSVLSALADQQEDIHKKFAQHFARKNVVAIISANTSQTAPLVLRTAKLFNEPVMVTVATNDKIIKGYEHITYRLLPQDRLQADAIVDWCKASPPNTTFGVLYDPSRYGSDLQAHLMARMGMFNFVPFPIGTTTDIVGTLQYGANASASGWIVIGYRNQAIEFLVKKNRLRIAGSVHLTDGAYGPWLMGDLREKVSISFPRWSKEESSSSNTEIVDLKGYGAFGHDAILIISESIRQLVNEGGQKHELGKRIADVAKQAALRKRLILEYDFKDGENTKAQFANYEVGNGIIP